MIFRQNNNFKEILELMPKVYLFLSILLGALGQVMFKMGIDKTQESNLKFYIELATNKWVILGFFSYGLSFLLWMVVLKHYDLSYARPLNSIGYVITYILAILVLKENFSLQSFAGVVLITFGVILLK